MRIKQSIFRLLLIFMIATIVGCERVDDIDEIATYTITFDTQSTQIVPNKTVYDGETLLDLPVPNQDGLIFTGWLYDEQIVTFPWLYDLKKDVTLVATYSHPEWAYEIEFDTITITGYHGSESIVTMPKTINGLPVMRIASRAFEDDKTIQHLTIANSVSIIGRLFLYHSQVQSVDFEPDAVITHFSNDMFYGANALQNVVIPRSVEVIGDGAFTANEVLTSVTFETGSRLREIHSYAFTKTGLQTITLPASIEHLGYWAFSDCYQLTGVYFESDHNMHTIQQGVFAYSENLLDFTFPSGVSTYPSYLFRGNKVIQHITLPEGVTLIEENAFYFMDALETVTLPRSVQHIESWAFPWLDSLTEVIIKEPSQLTTIEMFAFFDNPEFKKIIIPSSVTVIQDSAFYGNDQLVLYIRHSERPATWGTGFYVRWTYTYGEETMIWDYEGN